MGTGWLQMGTAMSDGVIAQTGGTAGVVAAPSTAAAVEPASASASFKAALATVLAQEEEFGAGTVGFALELLASGRSSLAVISERTLAAPGVQAMVDALVADGVLVRGADARNPRAYSLAGVSKGLTEPVRWGRPLSERAAGAAQAAGFGGANAALAAMGRGEVVAPVAAAGAASAGNGTPSAVSGSGIQTAGAVSASAAAAGASVTGTGSPDVAADHPARVAGFAAPTSPLASLPSILSLLPVSTRERTLASLWTSLPGLRSMLLSELGYAGPGEGSEAG